MPRRPAENHRITFTLHSAATTTKVLVVHSLSPAAEEGEDDDFEVSDDSGDVRESVDVLRSATPSFFTKVNGSR